MAHVLLVDDDEDVLSFLETVLSECHEVATACRGGDALQVFEKMEESDPFELVLTDMIMPGMGGAELAMEIAKRRKIPVLAFSGQGGDTLKYAFEMMRKGFFVEVIEKPVDDVYLLSRIASYL